MSACHPFAARWLLLRCALITSMVGVYWVTPSRGTTVISNLWPQGYFGAIGGIGESTPTTHTDSYYAQTFTTPLNDTRIRTIDFFALNFNDKSTVPYQLNGPVPIRLLLTTLGGSFNPGQVLFESPTIIVPPVPASTPYDAGLIEVTLPGGVLLQPATQYAFVLDAAVDANLADDIYPNFNVANANGFYNDGGFFDSHIAPGGTRAQAFSGPWDSFGAFANVDMEFQITFTPEPATGWLALAGGLMAIVATRLGSRPKKA